MRKGYRWHVWFLEELHHNGWAPLFRYTLTCGTREEAMKLLRFNKGRRPLARFRVNKYVAVRDSSNPARP